MKVKVLQCCGYPWAFFGLGLEHGLTSELECCTFWAVGHRDKEDRLEEILRSLAKREDGDDTHLRMIQVWADITAPLFWWEDFEAYKGDIVCLAEPALQIASKRPLTMDDFELLIGEKKLRKLSAVLANGFLPAKERRAALPDGFLHRRIVSFSYATLKKMILQHRGSSMLQWRVFLERVRPQVAYKWLLPSLDASETSEQEDK